MEHYRDIANRTASDAYARITLARIGSLVDPTEEYLLKLREQLLEWAEGVTEELMHSQRKANISSLPAHGFGGHAVPGADL